jgi:hypothetical protein
MWLRGCLAFVLGLGLAGGCVEKDSGGIVTTVNESKPLNDLDENEQQDLCEDVQAWAEDNLNEKLFQRIDCISDAVEAATAGGGGIDEAACQNAYSDCLNQPYEGEIDFSEAECNPDAFPSCDIAVGEYLACAEDSVALLNNLLNSFSCGNLEEFAQQEEPEYPASCQALEQRCPEWFGPEEDPPPPPPE